MRLRRRWRRAADLCVRWTATGGGIRPGQFQDFNLSLGQLSESSELVFHALQTYSSGETVN
jgi:Domain of unkown function (DUF1775)